MTSLPKHEPIHIHSFIYYTSLMLLNFHSLLTVGCAQLAHVLVAVEPGREFRQLIHGGKKMPVERSRDRISDHECVSPKIVTILIIK